MKQEVGTSVLGRTQIRQDLEANSSIINIQHKSADLQVTEQALKRAGLKEKYDKLRDQFGDMVMIP